MNAFLDLIQVHVLANGDSLGLSASSYFSRLFPPIFFLFGCYLRSLFHRIHSCWFSFFLLQSDVQGCCAVRWVPLVGAVPDGRRVFSLLSVRLIGSFCGHLDDCCLACITLGVTLVFPPRLSPVIFTRGFLYG